MFNRGATNQGNEKEERRSRTKNGHLEVIFVELKVLQAREALEFNGDIPISSRLDNELGKQEKERKRGKRK